MGCCGSKCCDLVTDDSGIFTPLSKRWCTDIVCLFFFLLFTIGMISIAVFSLNQGSINYILYPTDYLGQFCGHTPGVISRGKAFYPRLDADLKAQRGLVLSPTGFVNFQPYTLCLEECPTVFSIENPTAYGGPSYPGSSDNSSDSPTFYASFGTREIFNRCLPTSDSVPSSERELCNLPGCDDAALNATLLGRGIELKCTNIESQPSVDTAWEIDDASRDLCLFPITEINTQVFLPNGATSDTRYLEQKFADFIAQSFAVLRSITDSWEQVVLMGVAAPFAFAAAWFVLLFLFAGFIIYLAILLFLSFLLGLTIYMYVKAGWADGVVEQFANYSAVQTISSVGVGVDTNFSQTWYAVFAVVMTLISAIAIILIYLWRRVISRCIAIVREVTKIFFAMPLMMVYPTVEVFFSCGVVAYGILIGCFIITQGHSTFSEIDSYVQSNINGTIIGNVFGDFTDISQEVAIAVLMSIHVVGCVWGYYITQAAVYATLSRACAVWFFSHEAESGPAGGRVVLRKGFGFGATAILSSAWCIICKHLGSIVFGAAIMTTVKIIKWALTTVDYYTKDLQGTNMLLRVVVKCSQCCIWCLDKTVRFITKYGYIFVAIEGTNFCSACFKTMSFWSKYPSQIIVNEGVQYILSCVISLSIPTGAAFFGFVWIDAIGGHDPLWAAAAIWIIAFVIASSITDVFKCAIDTVFICAFQDMEEHSPPKYMSEALKDGFGMNEIEPINRKESTATASTDKDRGVSIVRPEQSVELNARM